MLRNISKPIHVCKTIANYVHSRPSSINCYVHYSVMLTRSYSNIIQNPNSVKYNKVHEKLNRIWNPVKQTYLQRIIDGQITLDNSSAVLALRNILSSDDKTLVSIEY